MTPILALVLAGPAFGAGTPALVVARGDAAALRAAGGSEIAPQLSVWRVPAAALPALRRAGVILHSEPDRLLARDTAAAADEPMAPLEWWRSVIGADLVDPPGPGKPVTIVDSGLDITHEEFASRPNTTLLNRQSVSAEEDGMFSTVLVDLLHAAVAVGDTEPAALLAGRLAGVTAISYQGRTLTNVARGLGAAAMLRGDRTQAQTDYERGLEWAIKIRHRPEIALTRLEMAELLLDEAVSGAGDEDKLTADKLIAEGLHHLDFAIDEFRAMKMQPALERALRHKGLLRA